MNITRVNRLLLFLLFPALTGMLFVACQQENNVAEANKPEVEKDSAFFISRANDDTIYTGVPFELEGRYKAPDPDGVHFTSKSNGLYTTSESPKYSNLIDSIRFERNAILKDSLTVVTFGKDTFPAPSKVLYQPETVVLLSGIPTSVSGLRHKENARMDLQYLTSESGLPSSYINTILFSKTGILWIGTPKGLSRYDGRSVITYTSEDGLPDDAIAELFEDSKGNLWIGTQYGGLAKYDGRTLTLFHAENGLHSNNISGITEDPQGNIWIGMWGGGIAKFDGKSIESIDRENGMFETRVQAITADANGTIWVATNGAGMYWYDGKKLCSQNKGRGRMGEQYLTTLMIDSQKRIWKGGWLSLSYIDGDTVAGWGATIPGIPTSEIFEDSKGNIWFSSFMSGVLWYDGKNANSIQEINGLPTNKVNDIAEDPAGNIWFATDGGGLCRYNPNSFTYFDESTGLNNKMVNAITETKDGRVVFATDGGLTFYNDSSFHRMYVNNGVNAQTGKTYALHRDLEDNIWFSVLNNAVYRLDEDSILLYGQPQGMHDHNITAIDQRKNGEMWFGAWNVGLSRLNEKGFTIFNAGSGLHNFIITDLLVDQNDILWIGTDGEGMTRYDGKYFKHITENEGLVNNHINALYKDSFNTLWVLTKKGINLVQQDVISDFPQKELLPDLDVVSMIQDAYGNYWIFTSNGLLYLKLKEGLKPTSWNMADYNPKLFTQFDGLIGMDFIPRSVFIDSKDRIWFGTGKGLMMKSLNNFDVTPKMPEINLQTIKLNGHFIDYNNLEDTLYDTLFAGFDEMIPGIGSPEKFTNYPKTLTLPPDVNHLTFIFSAKSWHSDKIKFSYRLKGVDEVWSQPSKDAWAEYRNLSYGDYTFELKGIGETGVESAVLEYPFTILPPWYHTWWARILFLLIIAVAIQFFVSFRTRHLKQKQLELEQKVQERTAELDVKNKALVSQNSIIEEQKAEAEKRKEEIEKQHTLLEETHKEIRDSINYAKRIQEAILPTQETIQQSFPDNFVFYKPKDVVAGDFYWIQPTENGVLFAAADCTGHGVPGAMVSVVCYNALNRSVREFGQTSPEKVLDKTREIVLETFQQNSAQVNDGMDASLICLRASGQNASQKILEFSGANNTVLIVRKGELHELEGDKQPVGNYKDAKPFTLKTFEVETGDMIYLFTDGYADQFGGPKGKKLKSKVLKELLVSLSTDALSIQKQKLQHHLEDWKGDLEQLDDISVFGFRI